MNNVQGITRKTIDEFSTKENDIMERLAEVTNLFMSLPDHHPSAKSEWAFFMHGLQGLMEHRLCVKIYPNIFR